MHTRTSFYCADTVFLSSEGFWQPCTEQVESCHFSNSVCSLPVSMSHFGNSYNISNLFVMIICVMVLCDQWSLLLHCNSVCGTTNHIHMRQWTWLMNVTCVVTAPLTRHSSISLLLWPSYSLRRDSIKIRLVNNPAKTSKFSSERATHSSF